MSDDEIPPGKVDLRASGPIDVAVGPEGIWLECFEIRLTGLMDVERAKHTAALLMQCVGLWEKHYRAFCHDLSLTVH